MSSQNLEGILKMYHSEKSSLRDTNSTCFIDVLERQLSAERFAFAIRLKKVIIRIQINQD